MFMMGDQLGISRRRHDVRNRNRLIVYGSRSDYVTGEGLPRIRALFPYARLRAIPNAGHWVYAD